MSLLNARELHVFHAQDRDIFSKLVLKFLRPPAESLLVMATWLWLEDFGFENIFSIILTLPDPLIVALANEAVSCFRCLYFNYPPIGQIPLTAKYMKKNISLQIIYKNRYSAITGIKNFLTTVCSRIFTDILVRVLPSSSMPSFDTRLRQPLRIPGFPHPIFGSINVMPIEVDRDNFSNNNLFFIPHGLWGWNANCIATENDRALFLTFSHGYPVTHAEIFELFTKEYGENCVEGVYMQHDNKKSPNANANRSCKQQSLFARLVLDSVATVDRVLDGEQRKELEIYGKNIWARKYEKRE
ncbi:hypothetical protein ISN44_As10g012990 [Arabidopsis suecica]|uniref:Uncharacterized protein n=1 Tax=Arabidopsis suecica TaxID=45249 RepID=A0A8T1ZWC1_ARASU|nr:hypothetical protein ISN44_As10g012990 [Arabidopsis suecica]